MARDLLRSRRFWPFLLLQACGALADNLYKNAIAVLIIGQAGAAGPVLVAAAGGVFILPFLLFSIPAGVLADRYDKARLVRLAKLAELLLMLAAAGALVSRNPAALLLVLFGLGAQAAFFGPIKYAIVPELLTAEAVPAATGWIEATTFFAILIGTVAGAALMAAPAAVWLAGGAGVVLAAIGLAAARLLPALAAAAPESVGARGLWRETGALFAAARLVPEIWAAILGLSWFWAVGAVFITEFPALAHHVFAAGADLVALFLMAFVLGVGAGAVATGRLAAGGVRLSPVPWALLAMALLIGDFAVMTHRFGLFPGGQTVRQILVTGAGWHLLADLFLIAAMGGVVSVLLYGVLQRAPAALRARLVAANNVLNAAFMASAALALMGLHGLGLAPPAIFAALAALALAVALVSFRVINQAAKSSRCVDVTDASG
ncbi:MAG: MFS transporter [Acidibrevibacterium sp.]|uniref:MFS transporter n=1 Tax=Acidibrevibacterium fodinaquatile TaxID=1969806 RepID=UPI0023A7B890|nr:MFS transporter [Acidibrevibacterium fodinaquatile]MCA7118124.1 MFS transporter [Acidibrevibacterium fodinaquatile]